MILVFTLGFQLCNKLLCFAFSSDWLCSKCVEERLYTGGGAVRHKVKQRAEEQRSKISVTTNMNETFLFVPFFFFSLFVFVLSR